MGIKIDICDRNSLIEFLKKNNGILPDNYYLISINSLEEKKVIKDKPRILSFDYFSSIGPESPNFLICKKLVGFIKATLLDVDDGTLLIQSTNGGRRATTIAYAVSELIENIDVDYFVTKFFKSEIDMMVYNKIISTAIHLEML